MKTKFVGLFAIAMVFIFSCKKDILDEPKSPTVTLLSPTDKSNGIDIVPTFTWEASDPDGKSLTYDFYIGPDSTGLVKEASNLTSPEFTLTNYSLKKENTYYWCVYVNNGLERVKSKQWSFRSIPAPESPVLSGPAVGSFVRDQLTFTWQPVVAGAGEQIVYDVYFGEKAGALEKIATVDGETSYTLDPSALEIEKVYYWKVAASDLINSSASEIASFKKLMPGAPDEPLTVSPQVKMGIYDATAKLTWTAVADPESDQVLYDVYMDNVYPPTTLVAEGITAAEYTTAALDANKPYYWKVVAKDASNHFTNSTVSSFTKLAAGSPGAPELANLEEDGLLQLDEIIKWDAVSEPDGQAVTYDVYVGDVFPPVNKVASDLTETEFTILNKDLSCDITNVKTFYCMVVAKDPDGNESNSVPLIFEPQMTGVFTDVRPTETNDYSWVRVGEQIWMSQNLRTTQFTDGTAILFGGPTLTVKDNPTMINYNEHPVWENFEGGWPFDWLETKGRVYTSAVAAHDMIAPSGWHVMNTDDMNKLKSYIPGSILDRVKHVLGTWHLDGQDTYGINCETAGWRYNNEKTDNTVYVEGYRVNLEQTRADLWVDDDNFGVLELNPGGNSDGNRWRYFTYSTNMMFGIRLVKNN